MLKRNQSFLVLAVALALVAGGYRLGSGTWPNLSRSKAPSANAETTASHVGHAALSTNTSHPAKRILYWKHPAGEPWYSASPTRTADGQEFVPVFEDEEQLLPGETRPAVLGTTLARGERRILYYRNPMGLPDTSPVPKKDSMGMDYIAVYEGEEEAGSVVKVSIDKVQRSGVRTAPAEMRRLDRLVRAPAIAKADERTLHTVTLRAEGFIEKLHVNATGLRVEAGQPMFRVYIPQLVSMQIDYRTAMSSLGKGPRSEQGPLQRIRNLGVPESVLQILKASPNPMLSIDWPSPINGVIMQKKVIEGQMVKAGEEMFRLADLSSIWVIGDVAEQDIGQIRIGSRAKVTFRAFPGEAFAGRVTFVLPELEMATRTAKVRIEVANPDLRIKLEMFADAEINTTEGEPDRLVVPVSALIDSGNRQVVIVDRGEGRFEPRPVRVGMRGEGLVEIIEGIKAGEHVVVTANFLIDAESNLKAALQAFTVDSGSRPEAKP